MFQTHVGMRSVKTVPLIQGRSKVRRPEENRGSTSGERPTLRRSLGLEAFPSIRLFRTCMHSKGNYMKKETGWDGSQYFILSRLI